MGNTLHDRFDVIIRCPCGRNLVFQIMEKPWRPKWRCRVCGSHEAKTQIWPIWTRGTKHDPRDLFTDPTTKAEKAAQDELKRRFGIA